MTLIGFTCRGDSAEFITDTACYIPSGAVFRRTTKSLVLHHITTAVLASGVGEFTTLAKVAAMCAAQDVDDVDELAAGGPDWLASIWADVVDAGGIDPEREHNGCSVFLIGDSPAAGEFVAYELASDDGFAPARVEGTHLQPTPWSMRPSRWHYANTMHGLNNEEGIPEELLAGIREKWPQQPPVPTPGDLSDWVWLALAARQDRTLAGPVGRIYVAGELLLTRLTRDGVSTLQAWDFEETGEDLEQLLQGSFHPLVQLGPCPCGSGTPFLDCHLGEDLDAPCPCGYGGPFRDCCMVVDREAVRPGVLFNARSQVAHYARAGSG